MADPPCQAPVAAGPAPAPESYWARRRRVEQETSARAALRAIPVPPSKRQLERWTELRDTIHRNYGSVVSPPGQMRIRFQVEGWNPLADMLRQEGYAVVPAGTAEVLWPVTDEATGIQNVCPCAVLVFEMQVEK